MFGNGTDFYSSLLIYRYISSSEVNKLLSISCREKLFQVIYISGQTTFTVNSGIGLPIIEQLYSMPESKRILETNITIFHSSCRHNEPDHLLVAHVLQASF